MTGSQGYPAPKKYEVPSQTPIITSKPKSVSNKLFKITRNIFIGLFLVGSILKIVPILIVAEQHREADAAIFDTKINTLLSNKCKAENPSYKLMQKYQYGLSSEWHGECASQENGLWIDQDGVDVNIDNGQPLQ